MARVLVNNTGLGCMFRMCRLKVDLTVFIPTRPAAFTIYYQTLSLLPFWSLSGLLIFQIFVNNFHFDARIRKLSLLNMD